MSKCVYLKDKTLIVSDNDYMLLMKMGLKHIDPIHGRPLIRDFDVRTLDSSHFNERTVWYPEDLIGCPASEDIKHISAPEVITYNAVEVKEIEDKDLPTYSRMVTK
jgi:hypothetical protein